MWKAVEEFLYATYEKGIWVMGYGLWGKKTGIALKQ